MSTALVTLTLALYLAAAGLLGRRLSLGINATQGQKNTALAIAVVGVLLHSGLLVGSIYTAQGLDLSFFPMLSIMGWAIALLIVGAAFGRPVENLAIAALPASALTLLLQWLFGGGTPVQVSSFGMELHILFSVFAYSVLSVAGVQALLIAVQDRHLRNRHPGGFMRALPPLETMEGLLVQMILVGFIALSIALLTGFIYLEDIFAQHKVHKTVLSIAAWAIFATLLYGRWRFGWRGRTAVRWTLGGLVLLLLAYFGSKFVLEQLLNAPK